jgi:hypothetical protein
MAYSAMFLLSAYVMVASLPKKERNATMLQLGGVLVGGSVAGGLVGLLVNDLSKNDGAFLGFAATGLVAGLSLWLYGVTNRPTQESQAKDLPMSRFSAFAMTFMSLLGALSGSVFTLASPPQDEWMPFVLALGGGLLGALLGAATQVISREGRR